MRLQVDPPIVTLYPNDRQLFTARATPPPPMWTGITGDPAGVISGLFELFVNAAGTNTAGFSAHQLRSGIGFVEYTIDDQSRPTSTGIYTINGFIFDVNGFQYFYSLIIRATQVEVRDEANVQLFTEAYSTLSGDVYRLEFAAGFRFYRNAVLKHSRINLPTTVIYPQTYQMAILEPTATAPTRIPPPRLIGDWRLGPNVIWTTPSHGSLTSTGPSLETEYFGGTTPGTYSLLGAIDAASDVGLGQQARATIIIPPLQILGSDQVVLQPVEKRRFKTNYGAAQTALIAWSVVSGDGSFTQGEYTAGSLARKSVVRATAAVNTQVADITVTVPALITNASNFIAAKVSEQIDFDTNIPVMPYFVAAGVKAEGTGAIIPALPLGLQLNDIMLLFVETANEAVSTPATWTIVADSPQGTGTAAGVAATRLSVFWKRATATEVAPTVADPGDHAIGQILAFRGCIDSGNPWDVTSGNTGASSTSVSIPGDTTTVVNCLVVLAVSNITDTATPQTSGYVNTDLANLTERTDINTISGNGGGFAVVTGEKAAIGAYAATTATLANASEQGRISIALKPALITWTASIGSINSTSGIWTAPSLTGQTALITASNGTLSVTIEMPLPEVFPRTDFKLPWPIDYAKRVLVSEAEDGSRTSRVKTQARRAFPVELLVDAVEDLNGAGLATVRAFWDRVHPGVKFILEDPEENLRLVVYSDSDLRWEHTGAGINIAFRVKQA